MCGPWSILITEYPGSDEHAPMNIVRGVYVPDITSHQLVGKGLPAAAFLEYFTGIRPLLWPFSIFSDSHVKILVATKRTASILLISVLCLFKKYFCYCNWSVHQLTLSLSVFVFLETIHSSEKLNFGHGISWEFKNSLILRTIHLLEWVVSSQHCKISQTGVDESFFCLQNKNIKLWGRSWEGWQGSGCVNMTKIHSVKFSKIAKYFKRCQNVYCCLRRNLFK